MSNETKKPDLIGYTVRKGKDGKSYFVRIAAAWANTKGGYNSLLDALPVNGEIVWLPPKENVNNSTE